MDAIAALGQHRRASCAGQVFATQSQGTVQECTSVCPKRGVRHIESDALLAN